MEEMRWKMSGRVERMLEFVKPRLQESRQAGAIWPGSLRPGRCAVVAAGQPEPCRWCQVPRGCSVGPEQLADWGFHPGQSGDLVHRAGCTPSRGHNPTLEPTKSACEEVNKLRGYHGPIRMVGCRDWVHTCTHTHTHTVQNREYCQYFIVTFLECIL